MSIAFDHDGHAQPFASHLQQGVAQRGAALDFGQALAGVHHVFDLEQQAPAKRASRM
ncbi:hypothetical protein D3C77_667010 [compost metagenome]